MKTVIVRTPETDRKLIEIPTKVSDLTTDDGEAITEVVGLARLIRGTTVSGSIFKDAAWPNGLFTWFDDWPLEKNVTRVDGGFSVPASGLYVVTLDVQWTGGGIGPSVYSPPSADSRNTAVVIGGATFELATKSDYGVGGPFFRGVDRYSGTLHLDAGSTVQAFLSWDSSIDTVSSGGDVWASLSLYRLP